MAFTVAEGLQDIPAAVAFAQVCQTAIVALPPQAIAKPSDYIKLAATILTAAAPLADIVAEQVKS